MEREPFAALETRLATAVSSSKRKTGGIAGDCVSFVNRFPQRLLLYCGLLHVLSFRHFVCNGPYRSNFCAKASKYCTSYYIPSQQHSLKQRRLLVESKFEFDRFPVGYGLPWTTTTPGKINGTATHAPSKFTSSRVHRLRLASYS